MNVRAGFGPGQLSRDVPRSAVSGEPLPPALRRSFGRRSAAKREEEGDPPALDASREHAGIEELTEHFRRGLARAHVTRAVEGRKRYRAGLEAWARAADEAHDHEAIRDELREAANQVRWHRARGDGQRARFAKVRACGGRMMVASCRRCGDERKPVGEGCGVRRVCKRCDVSGAIARRARFGRARGRLMVEAHRYGLGLRFRKGGAFTEKMLTLTLPHFDLAQASGVVAREARDSLHARILALFKAWPLFLRKLNDHWSDALPTKRDRDCIALHRAFEWTPGKRAEDPHGHPHFHVYLWCPWLPIDLVRAWWAEALRAVGWPVERYEDEAGAERDRVSVHLRMLRAFDWRAVRELLKGGKRSALTLSRVQFQRADDTKAFASRTFRGSGGGLDAFSYSEGWTLSDVEGVPVATLARLYMALEGLRLTQASRGFFVDDPPCECAACHLSSAPGLPAFRVRFEAAREAVEADAARLDAIERELAKARASPARAAPS